MRSKTVQKKGVKKQRHKPMKQEKEYNEHTILNYLIGKLFCF
jgi:hypothetical protein